MTGKENILYSQPSLPDDHSKVEPLLPIPNRTVKRLSADDSVQLACESRTSSGSPIEDQETPIPQGRGFLLYAQSSSLDHPRLT